LCPLLDLGGVLSKKRGAKNNSFIQNGPRGIGLLTLYLNVNPISQEMWTQ